MPWYWEYGNELLIMFLTPVVGLAFNTYLRRKTILILLLFSLVLSLPILAGYSHIFPCTYQLLGLVLGGIIFHYFFIPIKSRTLRTIFAWILSSLLFLGLGFLAFIDSFSGNETVQQRWNIERYRIEYTMSQGFSGQPSTGYTLSKYTTIPVLFKQIDYVANNSSVKNCIIRFNHAKMDFDDCRGTLKKVR